MKLKEYFSRYIITDDDKNTIFGKTRTFWGLTANYTIVALIIVNICVAIFASIGNNSCDFLYEIYYVNFFINSIFALEYIYRWSHSDNKLKFPFRFINIFHLTSFLPFFILSGIYGVGTYSIFAIFRVFRIFKIFELVERNPIIYKILRGIKEHKLEYISTILMTFIVLLFLSTLAYFVEYNWGDREQFYSIPHSLWWGLVTLTTTGYGDMIPYTLAGKGIAVILMVMGPLLIGVLSSITIVVFLKLADDMNADAKECERCGAKNGKKNKYCKNCGKKFKEE